MTLPRLARHLPLPLLLLGALLLGAACSGGMQNPPAVTTRAALQAFSGQGACTDLEQYIEDTAVLQMRKELEAARDNVPSWGWWGWWGGRVDGGVMLAGAPGAATPDRASAPSAYTTTNNQVAGVDEADLVKNDGTRIFVLSGEKLHAVKSWPPEATALQGELTIEGWPRELFLDGTDQAVVFSSIYQWYPLSHAMGMICANMGCGYWNSNTVKVTVVDVSDLANLKVRREYYLPGQYNSARKVGSSVRLVLSDTFNYPDGFQYYPPSNPDWMGSLFRTQAYDKIIAENEALIRKQTLADWLPAPTVKAGGTRTPVPITCSDFSKVNAPTRMGMVSVVTLDLAHDTVARNTILSEPGEIYASQKNLYVATRHWWWWPEPGQLDTTYLHKFDLTDPAAAHYVASGTVEGYIVDQFSMDESDTGYFRVVTTAARRVVDPANPQNWWGRTELTNRLTVLGERQGALEVVGQSEELAKGERVTASRILGNKGFVVTFRQVDPLFTFDLTDPAHPRKMAELKVEGFSTYLHPLDDTHLLTIGMYTSPNPTRWEASRIQLAIYDVSDLTAPRQTFTQLVGGASSWSEALYEHKAFNYFGARKLLAIPYADWSYGSNNQFWWGGFTSDLRVFGVDAATGFTPRGQLSVSDLYESNGGSNWMYYWQPAVRRSVMADDFVYAIGDSGLRVANVGSLGTPLATVTFTPYSGP